MHPVPARASSWQTAPHLLQLGGGIYFGEEAEQVVRLRFFHDELQAVGLSSLPIVGRSRRPTLLRSVTSVSPTCSLSQILTASRQHLKITAPLSHAAIFWLNGPHHVQGPEGAGPP